MVLEASGARRQGYDFAAHRGNIVAALNDYGKALADIGLGSGLHQHTGTAVETRDEVYAVMESVDTRVFKFAPDVGQLQKGGADAAKVVKDFAAITVHMHLKDFVNGPHMGGYSPLGLGTVDLKSILETMEQANPTANIMHELDGSRNMPYTARQTAEISKWYLQKLGYMQPPMSTSPKNTIDRRTLLKQGAGLLAAPWILPRIGLKAASERITVASIGVGIMGNGNLRRMVSNPDLQVVAVCDVDEWRLNDAKNTVETAYAAETKRGNYKGCAATKDFREILARPDIDAVLIATGDRWHAVISTMAAKAGKDVYCEKPVSLTIHESRVLVDTFRRHNRILQGGFQQRSVDDFAAARHLIQIGRIGTLKNIHCHWYGTSNVLNLPAEPTPPGLDWDMWLGPAPYHPFNSRYHPVGQRGSRTVPWDIQRDFAGGSITSNGCITWTSRSG